VMILSTFRAMCSAFGGHGPRGWKDVAWTAVAMAEEAPEELAMELRRFFTGAGE